MIEGKSEQHIRPSIEINGVRVFGELAGQVETDEVRDIKAPPEVVLHITRHLAVLSPEAKNSLCQFSISGSGNERPVDDAHLQMLLDSAGSKFHRAIDNPSTLIEFCREKAIQAVIAQADIPWVRLETGALRATLQIPITVEDKARFGIPPEDSFGTASVVEITPELEASVEKEIRGKGDTADNITVNVIRGMSEPPSDNLIIVIQKDTEKEPARLYTAYTGIPAPALPRPGAQSPEQLSYNSEWWDRHAFIKQ